MEEYIYYRSPYLLTRNQAIPTLLCVTVTRIDGEMLSNDTPNLLSLRMQCIYKETRWI